MNDENLAGIKLEVCCNYCHGKGRWREEGSGRPRRCGMCEGSGFIPTEFGQRILKLLCHNLPGLLPDQSSQGAQ